ncbi:MAG: putative addiction module antidote protein [Burkholderiaceae bacterium]|jgi:probable addiction module antidote protein|nr:putative addiction module antidote protein [Burkholderiaceae bacterium]
MVHKVKLQELPDFDVTHYLGDEQAIAEYLTAVLEDGDPSLLVAALGDIARARGMTDVARASGLAREALYKALRADSQPRFDTILRVCRSLGIRLVAQPLAQPLAVLGER